MLYMLRNAHPPDKPGRVVGSDIAGVVDLIGEGVYGEGGC